MKEEKKGLSKSVLIIVSIVTFFVIFLLFMWQFFGISIGDVIATIGVASPQIAAIRFKDVTVALDYGVEVIFDVKNNNKRSMKLFVGVYFEQGKQWYKEREFIIPPDSVFTAIVTFFEPELLATLLPMQRKGSIKVIRYSLIN